MAVLRERRTGYGRRACLASLLVLGAALTACMENEIVAPEPLDVDALNAYYPGGGDSWERKRADEVGFDPELLAAAVELAERNEAPVPNDIRSWLAERLGDAPEQRIVGPIKDRGPMNGLIVKNGYIVREWGETERVDMAFSVTKSFVATLVGLAADRGQIPALEGRVGELVTDGGYRSAQNEPITWEMSLRQTSEWEGTLFDKPDRADRREGADRELQAPGTFWEYNDVRVNRLALSALRVWEEPLPEVLDREIMQPIGASRSWRWHGYRNSTVDVDGVEIESVSGGGHWGGGLWINSRDLARFGLLHLREGKWRDRQILSAEWVRAATAPGALNPAYGYMWWVNAGRELWPSLPANAYAARGGGGHLLLVVPDDQLVVVVRWLDSTAEDEFFGGVMEALVGEAGG